MGIALWAAAAVAAFLLARIVPIARDGGRLAEVLTALFAAAVLGLTATALDFGGWNEADPRAGTFVFLGSFAAIGLVRALRRKPSSIPNPGGPR